MIYNTRFETVLKKPLLERIEFFLSKQKDEAIRYAVVDKKKGKAVIEATMIKRS